MVRSVILNSTDGDGVTRDCCRYANQGKQAMIEQFSSFRHSRQDEKERESTAAEFVV